MALHVFHDTRSAHKMKTHADSVKWTVNNGRAYAGLIIVLYIIIVAEKKFATLKQSTRFSTASHSANLAWNKGILQRHDQASIYSFTKG